MTSVAQQRQLSQKLIQLTKILGEERVMKIIFLACSFVVNKVKNYKEFFDYIIVNQNAARSIKRRYTYIVLLVLSEHFKFDDSEICQVYDITHSQFIHRLGIASEIIDEQTDHNIYAEFYAKCLQIFHATKLLKNEKE